MTDSSVPQLLREGSELETGRREDDAVAAGIGILQATDTSKNEQRAIRKSRCGMPAARVGERRVVTSHSKIGPEGVGCIPHNTIVRIRDGKGQSIDAAPKTDPPRPHLLVLIESERKTVDGNGFDGAECVGTNDHHDGVRRHDGGEIRLKDFQQRFRRLDERSLTTEEARGTRYQDCCKKSRGEMPKI